jgi:hypothetical protein
MYFGAAAGGVILAACTALLLNKPLRQALQTLQIAKFFNRLLPFWLILTVILGFISVNYLECRSYAEVVNDRQYIIEKSQDLVFRMAFVLKIALFVYAVILIPQLYAAAKSFCAGKE